MVSDDISIMTDNPPVNPPADPPVDPPAGPVSFPGDGLDNPGGDGGGGGGGRNPIDSGDPPIKEN
jgi:hypothetical protein